MEWLWLFLRHVGHQLVTARDNMPMGELKQHNVITVYVAVVGDLVVFYLGHKFVSEAHLTGKAYCEGNIVILQMLPQGLTMQRYRLGVIFPPSRMNGKATLEKISI